MMFYFLNSIHCHLSIQFVIYWTLYTGHTSKHWDVAVKSHANSTALKGSERTEQKMNGVSGVLQKHNVELE